MGNVVEFLKKMELHSALKGYDGEKKAQNLASRLAGPAFDVYLRLSEGDQKDVDKISTELLKEFKRGQQDREEAIAELQNRRRMPNEPTQTFAYKLIELVKLAYPDFDESVRKTIAKDYFVKGVHPDMQIALKSHGNFSSSDINALATETTRLQLAGINSFTKQKNVNDINSNTTSINSVDYVLQNTSLVESTAETVIQKLQLDKLTDSSIGNNQVDCSRVNEVNNVYRGRGYTGNSRNSRSGYRRYQDAGKGKKDMKCRSCQNTGHWVKECPTRFCQACGNRGHDAWNKSCPNYQ